MSGKAEFNQHRNDLHWSFYAGSDGFIRWGGYDDAYWWNNVSNTPQAREQVGKVTGRKFTLDHETNEVTISDARENADA